MHVEKFELIGSHYYNFIHIYNSPVCEDAKCILHHPTCPGQPIIEDALLPCHQALREWFHQPGTEGEGIISYYVERDWLIIRRQGSRFRQSRCFFLQSLAYVAVRKNATIRTPENR